MTGAEEKLREKLLQRQHEALRDPAEVITAGFEQCGITSKSLQHRVTGGFISLLEKLKLTLLVTREYEHLVLALTVRAGKLHQSFLNLPHPAGIAVNRKTNKVYVAATRNPNAIVELVPSIKIAAGKKMPGLLMPSRLKYYSGSTYFHDLAFINGELHANSVGQNGIIKINMDSSETEEVYWMPACVKGKKDRNHIQLNSIAAGKTIKHSYFSASTDTISQYKPGDLRFAVDKKGVLFDGMTGRTVARGLTRPHSARLYKGKIWVDNSGYGEFGFIRSGSFIPLVKLPGWTRGLCFAGNVAFVGVSRIIKKFKAYAPGITNANPICSVYAVDIRTGEILGSIQWKFGNQIFGIDSLPASVCSGFPFEKVAAHDEHIKNIFFRYSV